jgi:hypothetical protein
MKTILLAAGAVFLILAASGCTESPQTCPPPYSDVNGKCCLDGNNNSICDFEEHVTPAPSGPPKNYSSYEVKMYISPYSPEPDSWSKLPSSPVRNFDGYQIYNYPQNSSYYDGGWFMLYSRYTLEPITCLVNESYNSAFYKEYAMHLIRKDAALDMNGAIMRALFSTDSSNGVLLEVRYAISCTGDESGIKFHDVYVVGVRTP